MFFLLYFGLSKVWHVRFVPFFFFFFSLQTGFSFLALCSVSCRRLKDCCCTPRKKGEHTEERETKFSYISPLLCCLASSSHGFYCFLEKRERERKGHEKSIRLFFPSLSFSPLPMEEAFKREKKGRGDRGRKEEKEAL